MLAVKVYSANKHILYSIFTVLLNFFKDVKTTVDNGKNENSKIINNLFDEADLGLKIEDFFNEDCPKNNDLLLRCYSVSLLEEAYNVVL